MEPRIDHIAPMDAEDMKENDAYMSFPEASKIFDRHPDPRTIRNWCLIGMPDTDGKRCFLRYKRIGGRIYTKWSWYEKFVRELNEEEE